MKEKEEIVIGFLDDSQLQALKTQHKVKYIHEVITEDEDGGKHATYFKKPELKHLELVAAYAKKEKAMEGMEVLFNTCRLSGSEAVLVDEEMKSAAYADLGKIFKKRETVVKKR
jgi:hypothetical protein